MAGEECGGVASLIDVNAEQMANGRWIDDRSFIRLDLDLILIYIDRCRFRISTKIGALSV